MAQNWKSAPRRMSHVHVERKPAPPVPAPVTVDATTEPRLIVLVAFIAGLVGLAAGLATQLLF